MKTIQVLCNLKTITPLQDVLDTRQTGWWRINPADASTATHVEIFDEETLTKVGGKIINRFYEDANEDHGAGWVFEFEPKEIGGHFLRSYNTTRPQFNRIGFAIK